MKKKISVIYLLLIIFSLLISVDCLAANKFFWATDSVGTTGTLDAIDGDLLTDGDMAIVGRDNSGVYEVYFYRVEDYALNPPDEASPNTITPNTNSGNKRWKLLKIYSNSFVLSDTSGIDAFVGISPASATTSYTLTLPAEVSTLDPGLFGCDSTGVCTWIDPSTLVLTESYIPLSTILAEGDVVVGSDINTVTVISKGDSNTLFGVDNTGKLGFYDKITTVLNAAPTTGLYSGTVISLVAGESIAQGSVVYCKVATSTHKCYKYDANGADKAMPARYLYVGSETLADGQDGLFLVNGTFKLDGFTFITDAQDEGKVIYAGTDAGAMTVTAPATSGDMRQILGYVLELDTIHFNPCPVLVEVP